VAPFATPEWIGEISARAARAEIDSSLELTVEQRITDSPTFAWHVAVADGRVVVTAGGSPDASLRLASDRATAEAIHTGELSAQRAFLDGALRIGGDISRLIAHRSALDAVARALADVT
jgi:predicted lipid carrier protein YhbT